MKRLAAVAALLVSLAVVPVAYAHHTASGAQKRAILQSIDNKVPRLGPVNNSHNCQKLAVPCWQVIVSADSWASSRDNGPGNDGAAEFAYISHLEHGQWKYVGGWGEGIGVNCQQVGMPSNVVHDLHVYCTPS